MRPRSQLRYILYFILAANIVVAIYYCCSRDDKPLPQTSPPIDTTAVSTPKIPPSPTQTIAVVPKTPRPKPVNPDAKLIRWAKRLVARPDSMLYRAALDIDGYITPSDSAFYFVLADTTDRTCYLIVQEGISRSVSVVLSDTANCRLATWAWPRIYKGKRQNNRATLRTPMGDRIDGTLGAKYRKRVGKCLTHALAQTKPLPNE